ncbi:MAG: hypothetical protein M1828_004039, partial [Chrysothrix sp. TS-e1954]
TLPWEENHLVLSPRLTSSLCILTRDLPNLTPFPLDNLSEEEIPGYALVLRWCEEDSLLLVNPVEEMCTAYALVSRAREGSLRSLRDKIT